MAKGGEDMNRRLLLGSVGILIGIAVVAVLMVNGAKKPATSTASPNTQSSPQKEVSTPEANSVVKEITVTGNEYSYSPNSLTLQKGEQIKLSFKNAGNLPHNLLIDELGVATKTVKGGDSDTVTFTADKSGTFKFYCSVGNHRAQGMEGMTTVK